MARSLNKVMLIGNVGKDPDVRYTAKGDPVATFPLATSEVWRDKDGIQQERTDWHNIVAWQKLAEIIRDIVKKGSRLYIEGKIKTRNIEGRDGEKRLITEIVVDNMLLLDGREVREQRAAASRSHEDEATAMPHVEAVDDFVAPIVLEDDLPF